MAEIAAYSCMGVSWLIVLFLIGVSIRFVYRRIKSRILFSKVDAKSCPECNGDAIRYKYETYDRKSGEKKSIFSGFLWIFFGLPMIAAGAGMVWIGIDEIGSKGANIYYTDVNIPFLGNPFGWLIIGLVLLGAGLVLTIGGIGGFGGYFVGDIGNRFEFNCKDCGAEWQLAVS